MMSKRVSSEKPAGEARNRIGVFGGTFDPIHIGHLIVAAEAVQALHLETLLFAPAGQPPHKPDVRISPAAHRVSMIEIAIRERPHFGLSEIDLHRPGLSYSVDLLARLQDEYPRSDLFYLIGADSLRDLHTWYEPERIPALATLVVAGRPGVTVQAAEVVRAIPSLEGRILFIDTPLIDISSTDIRDRVHSSRPIWRQVPREVENYIATHNLYR